MMFVSKMKKETNEMNVCSLKMNRNCASNSAVLDDARLPIIRVWVHCRYDLRSPSEVDESESRRRFCRTVAKRPWHSQK